MKNNVLLICVLSLPINAYADFGDDLKYCKTTSNYISSKLDKLKTKNQIKREEYIDETFADLTFRKDLINDMARQYEHNGYKTKWESSFNFCLDHINDDAYKK